MPSGRWWNSGFPLSLTKATRLRGDHAQAKSQSMIWLSEKIMLKTSADGDVS
jgi:hypothetical protein